jgi:fatty acid desaturase
MEEIIMEDVEKIVNKNKANCETKASKKREERLSRLLRKTITSLLLSAVFGLLGYFNLMVIWLAYPVFAVFALAGAFMYGKFVEAKKGRK